MKEIYQTKKEVTEMKQWESVQEMMRVTLCDYEEFNHEPEIDKKFREDDAGKNIIIMHLPVYEGENFHIGQVLNLSLSLLTEEDLLRAED